MQRTYLTINTSIRYVTMIKTCKYIVKEERNKKIDYLNTQGLIIIKDRQWGYKVYIKSEDNL